MKIAIAGASGPTGRHLVDQARAAGHRVTAISRTPDGLGELDGVSAVAADVRDGAAVATALAGCDAVVSVLGSSYTRRPVTVYSDGVSSIIAAMRRRRIRRLAVVSSNMLDPCWRPDDSFFYRRMLDPILRRMGRTVYDDMRRMEALVRESGLDWTIVRSSGLFDLRSVTNYRVAEGSAAGQFTARSDLAACLFQQVNDCRYVGAAVGVVTTDVRPSVVQLIRSQSKERRPA